MKKIISIIVMFVLGTITSQATFLLLLHEKMREQRNINIMIRRLTMMKDEKLFKDSTLYDTYNQDLEKAIIYYKEGAYKVSLPIFEKIATDGNATARYFLARSYYYGQGTDQNYKIAIELFAKNNGITLVDANSLFLLSRSYRYGKGTTQNIHQAENLVIEAACRGLNDAIELLQIEKEMSRNDVLDWLISILNTKCNRNKKSENEVIPNSAPTFGLG